MTETRKIAAILAADVVGFSRMASADEDRTLARLRALRADLIDPTIASQNGRVFKRTGDGALVEFRSVVEAVRCAITVQNAMIERNVGMPADQRIEFRIGIHLGDVVEESDGDLMGDGVNIAARLEGIAAPGAICLSEQAYWQVKGRLDLAVTDLGPTRLKNIAEPVRAYSLQVGVPALAKPAAAEAKSLGSKRRSTRTSLVAGIVALILFAGGAWYLTAGNRGAAVVAIPSPPAGAAHLSIVVLPFANLSNDPAQNYFADGVTENLTTDLSRIRDSFVIARNTADTYKGKTVDAKQIGKELGVRYVLEGSVQRDGIRVRVNAQLIDAQSGAHLWADRFEDDVADLFKLQDQVVARLANSLGNELVKAEAHAGARSGNPDAIDLHMRGWALLTPPMPKERNDAARALFDAALALDPNDPDALAGEAYTYMLDYSFGWTVPGVDYDAKALGSADRALALAPDTLRAYDAKSYYLAQSNRPDEGIGVADAGLAIDPNYARLYAARANAELPLGRFEQAKSDAQQAARLSPRDPEMGFWHTLLCWAENGLAHFDAAIDECHKSIEAGWRTFYSYHALADAEFSLGHFEAAIDAAHKMIEAGDRTSTPYGYLATNYALEGKMDEAKTALTEALRLNPKLTVNGLTWGCPTKDNVCLKYAEGLRKAGLPEQ